MLPHLDQQGWPVLETCEESLSVHVSNQCFLIHLLQVVSDAFLVLDGAQVDKVLFAELPEENVLLLGSASDE